MKNTVKITPKGAVQLANGEAAERGAAAYALNLREREDALASVGSCLNIGSLCNGERVVLADCAPALFSAEQNLQLACLRNGGHNYACLRNGGHNYANICNGEHNYVSLNRRRGHYSRGTFCRGFRH